MTQAPICPECGRKGTLRDSSIVYGRSYGRIWYCDCIDGGVYVGCHRDTSMPMGNMANASLRALRKRAHAAFDPIWRKGQMPRLEAYSWLAARMSIPVDRCHIAMFDEEQCEMAERIARYRRGLLHVKKPKR